MVDEVNTALWSIDSQLDELAKLGPGWCGGDGDPIAEQAMANTRILADALARLIPFAPAVVPLADGGIQLEWHTNGVDMEVVVSGEGQASLDAHKCS